MKRKRMYALNHSNEWVIILSLTEAYFIGPITVWARTWRRQWRPCQPRWQWRASTSGTLALTSHVCSASFPPTALLSYSGDVTFKLLPRCQYSILPKITAFISSLSQIIIFVFWFGRSLALSLALGFFLLMARGKWTTCFATNTKKGEHQSRVFPFHLTGVYRYLYQCQSRYKVDGKRKQSLGSRELMRETQKSLSLLRRKKL